MLAENTAKFLPAFFVNRVEMNSKYEGGKLPLHLTLFPPLHEKYDSDYGHALRSAINPQTPFDVIVGEDDLFGEQGDVRVKRIEKSGRLLAVHESLVKVVATLLHDPTYLQPFNPHITVERGQDIKTGSLVRIGGFAILEKISGQPWEVVDKIGLKGGEING